MERKVHCFREFRAKRPARFADEGIGIHEPDLAWSIKAFHRARNVGNIAGTSLDGRFCSVAWQYRCQIMVESAVDKGTTLTVKFGILAGNTL
ncbi:hypothetical protein Cflav_PD3592 [Pedosphaera parvula Ellin514]|uniref:Uncharacterized protein n=2 Tax=Pedosphaera TaxID=1032526 RepID=B9XH99_PEDPL|nr:hypothetical protein Cflav_PD3592 [Pedosphaera parvula Ellin514]